MRYAGRMLVLLLTLCLLTGCGDRQQVLPSTAPTLAQTQPPETELITEPAPTEPPATEPSLPPEHSELYIPGLSVEDLILYFNEVCLDAEITHSGDPSVLQKWAGPISYILYGDCTDEDMTVLSYFVDWLNSIEGFPGIRETEDPGQANLRIHFCTQPEMLALMGNQFTGMDGAVTFWYMDDEIYDATICIRTDLTQSLRNSVILEELYNGLGPIQDTYLRADSIIYADFSEPQQLTDIDELILKLLYHPQLLCGMDSASCEAVIRELYY